MSNFVKIIFITSCDVLKKNFMGGGVVRKSEFKAVSTSALDGLNRKKWQKIEKENFGTKKKNKRKVNEERKIKQKKEKKQRQDEKKNDFFFYFFFGTQFPEWKNMKSFSLSNFSNFVFVKG